MATLSAEDILRGIIGGYVLQIAALSAEIERLRELVKESPDVPR